MVKRWPVTTDRERAITSDPHRTKTLGGFETTCAVSTGRVPSRAGFARARESGGRAVSARPLSLSARLVGALGPARPRSDTEHREKTARRDIPEAAAARASAAPPPGRRDVGAGGSAEPEQRRRSLHARARESGGHGVTAGPLARAAAGSYASGTATESSDIDLLVISRSTLPRREREVRLTRRLFGSGVPYDLLVLTPEEMEERIDSPSYAARSSSTPRAGNIETTSRWSINWTSFSGRLAKP